ncbi:hypothetical protein Ahia01_000394100 [Argonauta hians]
MMENHKTGYNWRSKPPMCHSKYSDKDVMNIIADHAPPSSQCTSIYPDIYTQLDAKVAKKIRISNAGLTGQMDIQKRMLEKSKQHSLKHHQEEVLELQNDLEKLHVFSPSWASKNFSPGLSYSSSQVTARVHHTCRLPGSHMLCHRCYKHHTPYKNIYYQNWWLKKPV